MITVEDIQIKVYQLLKEKLKAVKLTGSVGYTRHDFTKEDVIILSKVARDPVIFVSAL